MQVCAYLCGCACATEHVWCLEETYASLLSSVMYLGPSEQTCQARWQVSLLTVTYYNLNCSLRFSIEIPGCLI